MFNFDYIATGHSLSIGNFEKTSYVMFCSPLLALHILCHPVYLMFDTQAVAAIKVCILEN